MKLSVKTLKGTRFEIEVNPTDTVADVKKTIETIQGSDVFPAAQQLLIHQGKVLQDETSTLADHQVSEQTFLVVMNNKNKASSARTAPVAPQPTQPAPPPPQAPAQAQAAAAPAPQVAVSSVGPNANPLNLFPPAHPAPPQGAGVNANPLDIFPQGLPGLTNQNQNQNLLLDSQSLQALLPQLQGSGLGNNPQFLEMIQALQNNPELMGTLLQAAGGGGGGIDGSLDPMDEPFYGEDGGAGVLAQLLGGGGGGAVLPQQMQVAVTPEEGEAIQRLEAMGFDPNLVVQVFFACNKDEALAANYLLDHIDN
ncbi:OLC1v1030204C1 [Oldenlandia corymbosa var. corymbosa]|uniref:Ubiquitin receptor RAD23 n=1 Tax=Oldenlandia corymbosa var. corymbosa TaxID=529605 RepID=A0AAV1CFG8_OLDCO|nr:OLC1v1030204C1 [Oldenlandia corymbosa var. corymbosa]